MDAMGMGYEVIRLAPTAAQHVDAYLEYHRIVGDDGGPLLSGACSSASQQTQRALPLGRRLTDEDADAQTAAPPPP